MATTCKLIAKTTLGSAASTVTLDNIPQTYTDLLLLASIRSNRNNTVDNTLVRFNGEAANASILSCRILYGTGATAGSDSVASGGMFLTYGGTPAAQHTSNTFGTVEMYVPNYAGNTNKSVSITFAGEANSASGVYMGAIAGLRASTAAIESMTFSVTAGETIASGSSFYLYGITRA